MPLPYNTPDDNVCQIVKLRCVIEQGSPRLVHYRGELYAPGAIRPEWKGVDIVTSYNYILYTQVIVESFMYS